MPTMPAQTVFSNAVRRASSTADFEAFGALIRQYVAWCVRRYGDLPWFVEEVFNQQSLDRELQVLSTAYAPPNGKAVLATYDGKICGGVAYRKL